MLIFISNSLRNYAIRKRRLLPVIIKEKPRSLYFRHPYPHNNKFDDAA
jgi:hypothetical protein